LQSGCKNGSRCAWLHDEEKKNELIKSGSHPSNPKQAEKNPQPCFFFFSSNCIKGDQCPYSHELLFDEEEPAPSVLNKGQTANILTDMTMTQLINTSKDKECSICFDGVVSQKRLFGLLSTDPLKSYSIFMLKLVLL